MKQTNNNYFCIGLHNPKTPANVGGVLRAAGIFGAEFVAVSGIRMKKFSSKIHVTNVNNYHKKSPLIFNDNLKDIIPYNCKPVAVDLIGGAKSIIEYQHPQRAFYVFGPEDGTLGKSVLSWCSDIIYIPVTPCLNLAACVNVVLFDRLVKFHEQNK